MEKIVKSDLIKNLGPPLEEQTLLIRVQKKRSQDLLKRVENITFETNSTFALKPDFARFLNDLSHNTKYTWSCDANF